jgi:uncharacterized protein
MQIIPGGEIPLQDIVGRDALVTNLVKTLKHQSVRLVAERRVGKSTVLRSLQANTPENWLVFRHDIGAIENAREFAQLIIGDLNPYLGFKEKALNLAGRAAKGASGSQIGPLKLPNFEGKQWKPSLLELFAFVQEHSEYEKIVFLWDELPWMLQKITQSNPKEAMDLLDLLRSMRQTHNKFRMVYTGSLGLHHVLRILKEQGYNGAPANDMQVVDVPPLAPRDAVKLTEQLCADNEIAINDPALYPLLAQAVDHLPYYIHLILSAIKQAQDNQNHTPLTAQTMRGFLDAGVTASEDPWELKHYLDRTRDYYRELRAPSLALIDAVASHAQPITVQTALNAAKASHPDIEHDTWIELLNLLEQDHYFNRDSSNQRLSFKFNVVKQWWLRYRHLPTIQAVESV